jgi:hypothetical protein
MPVSNIDQTAAGLFAIMTSNKGGEEETTGPDQYEH